MNGDFKINEIAIFTGDSSAPTGYEVEIVGRGPWEPLTMQHPHSGQWNLDQADYLIQRADGLMAFTTEPFLRKRPQPGDTKQNFRSELKPCDNLFREQFTRKHGEPVTLEARIAAVFPPIDALTLIEAPYGAHLQPFDHFFGAYDA